MLKTCIIMRFPRLAINYKLSTINYKLNINLPFSGMP